MSGKLLPVSAAFAAEWQACADNGCAFDPAAPNIMDGVSPGLVIGATTEVLACMAVGTEGPGQGLALRGWYMIHGFGERARPEQVSWKRGRR